MSLSFPDLWMALFTSLAAAHWQVTPCILLPSGIPQVTSKMDKKMNLNSIDKYMARKPPYLTICQWIRCVCWRPSLHRAKIAKCAPETRLARINLHISHMLTIFFTQVTVEKKLVRLRMPKVSVSYSKASKPPERNGDTKHSELNRINREHFAGAHAIWVREHGASEKKVHKMHPNSAEPQPLCFSSSDAAIPHEYSQRDPSSNQGSLSRPSSRNVRDYRSRPLSGHFCEPEPPSPPLPEISGCIISKSLIMVTNQVL